MRQERDDSRLSATYLEHRAYLVDLAFRMLGDIGAAQDVVQDAFTRLIGADLGEIGDERGWLIVVTSRLCLDQIRSARSRRERAHDAGQIEYLAPPVASALADPADRVTFDDQVSLALLALLQHLTPAERVAFVLHDVFALPFDDVARTVGRTAQACRQLARRARLKISASAGAAGLGVSAAEHRLVTEKFIAACAGGDLTGLLEVLAPDAWGELVLGQEAGRPRVVVTGADQVARNLLRFWGSPATLVSLPAIGQPALLAFTDREVAGVLVLTTREQVVQAVTVIADPRLLSFVSSRLTSGTP
jgi:RNA polymerase sigma-70 factor, ECF subfamily